MGTVCCHGNMHTWNCIFVSEVLYLSFLTKMSGVKPRWVKRKRQLSRVESMLAAKSQRAAPGESSSVQQPDHSF